MSIVVTITAETPDEFRNLISGFSASVLNGEASPANIVAPTPPPAAPAAPGSRNRKPAETAAPEVAGVADKAPVDISDQPVTIEQLRAKATEKSQSGKQPEVKALLAEYESKSVSTLPVERHAEFLKALEAL